MLRHATQGRLPEFREDTCPRERAVGLGMESCGLHSTRGEWVAMQNRITSRQCRDKKSLRERNAHLLMREERTLTI